MVSSPRLVVPALLRGGSPRHYGVQRMNRIRSFLLQIFPPTNVALLPAFVETGSALGAPSHAG